MNSINSNARKLAKAAKNSWAAAAALRHGRRLLAA